jgi:hypothetical protein
VPHGTSPSCGAALQGTMAEEPSFHILLRCLSGSIHGGHDEVPAARGAVDFAQSKRLWRPLQSLVHHAQTSSVSD